MKINGDIMELSEMSIADMLDTVGFDRKYVVVEVNEEIVPRKDYDSYMLSDSDSVEVIRFVGGG